MFGLAEAMDLGDLKRANFDVEVEKNLVNNSHQVFFLLLVGDVLAGDLDPPQDLVPLFS